MPFPFNNIVPKLRVAKSFNPCMILLLSKVNETAEERMYYMLIKFLVCELLEHAIQVFYTCCARLGR